MKVDRSQRAKQRRLASALGEIGFALPGSLTVRAYRCGKQNCRCRGEPPQLHGPYAFWTRKIDGKTVTRMLSEEELADYQPLFDNARRLRELMSELHKLSLQLIEPAEDPSGPKPGAKPSDVANRSGRSWITRSTE
ncbi:MAG: hypothetical protein M0Z95_04130 [Actinomycetota bacterium]|nr:hypothetical protein [Actinomycetota bacterium]